MALGSPTVDFLRDLIAFPTVSRTPNRKLIDYCRERLDAVGARTSIIENDDGTRANLYATIGPDDRGGVLLSGHTDVVPADGQSWTRPPFEATLADGRIYGRGAADMKGFVASALAAGIAAGKKKLETPLHLAFSYDEEIGCIGVRSLIDTLEKAPVKPAMCIVGEPTGMAVATGHKGKTSLVAQCIGSEAHSAFAPQAVNAIHLACDLVAEIRRLQDELQNHGTKDNAYDIPYTTLHTGIIISGVALNIVPKEASVTFEIRNLMEDDPVKILARLKKALEPIIETARKKAPEADITIEITGSYPGFETALSSEVVEFVQSLIGSNRPVKVAFGTEGGLFAERLGVPVVVCGPGSMEQGHKPDEFVSLEQLAACDSMLAALIDRLERGI